MKFSDLTDEDRELYEELFGIPFTEGREKSSLLIDRFPWSEMFPDDPFWLIPRAAELAINPSMGTSNIEHELIDPDFVERAIQKFESKLSEKSKYQKLRIKAKEGHLEKIT